MNIRELKIENLIQNLEGETYSVTGLGYDEYGYPTITTDEFETISQDPSSYSPIPLTEEILLRFGFIKGYYNGGIDFKLYDFEITKGNDWEFFNYSTIDRDQDGINQCDINIESVHQLQNLFFTLKEIELKRNNNYPKYTLDHNENGEMTIEFE